MVSGAWLLIPGRLRRRKTGGDAPWWPQTGLAKTGLAKPRTAVHETQMSRPAPKQDERSRKGPSNRRL